MYTEVAAPDVLFLSLSSDAGEKRNALSCYSYQTIDKLKEYNHHQRKLRLSGKRETSKRFNAFDLKLGSIVDGIYFKPFSVE